MQLVNCSKGVKPFISFQDHGENATNLSRILERKLRLDTAFSLSLSLLRVGFFNRGETRADLKCEEKQPSESDRLTVDVIDVTTMSILSFTKLIGTV